MKGIIFTTFNDMVEEKFGLSTWEKLLDTVKPMSGGIYTAGNNYPDEELMALIQGLGTMKKIPQSNLEETFGEYMFPVLIKKYPVFLSKDIQIKDFLKSVHHIIHVEVKKLYPDVNLPEIAYEEPTPQQLIMLYRSPRKLCHLAVGLIKGAALHFKKTLAIHQPICMHQGKDHCRLEINFD